jgi:hypothetical protein
MPKQCLSVLTRASMPALAGKAPIEKAGTKFAVQLTIRPTFNVLEHDTAQQPIWSDPIAASFVRLGRACGQELSAQSY